MTTLDVVDLGPTGMGLARHPDVQLTPGTQLSDLSVAVGDQVVWRGAGAVVYQGPDGRVGVRFTSASADLERVRFADTVVGQRLDQEIHEHERLRQSLPVSWRAGVSMVRQLFERVRDDLAALESRWTAETRPSAVGIRSLVRLLHHRWIEPFNEQVLEVDRLSAEFDEETREIARIYAARELMPLLLPCPMHRRAYEKPRGYAGDYRLMTLYFSEDLEGDTLYAKFLHYVAQHYSLGRTVIERVRSMKLAVQETLSADRPVRVLSLASGPALEIQHLLRESGGFAHRPELLFVDQDQEALAHAHDSLTRVLLDRGLAENQPSLTFLHFSVRQILKPETTGEVELLQRKLSDLDLIYSAGLFDYLDDRLCRALLAQLYAMLAPGGRLFIGNLERVPDTSWIMEYALTWLLVYREEETMLSFAADLQPAPASARVVRDATGHCLFLEVVRPA